jgi:hypothetical protein
LVLVGVGVDVTVGMGLLDAPKQQVVVFVECSRGPRRDAIVPTGQFRGCFRKEAALVARVGACSCGGVHNVRPQPFVGFCIGAGQGAADALESVVTVVVKDPLKQLIYE